MEVMDKTAKDADEFNALLHELAVGINADLSQVVRSTVLRLFAKIIQRSPVDTGAYRGSHQIANHDPGPDEGVIKSPYKAGTDKAGAKKWADDVAKSGAKAWTWQPGWGSIWIFNNVPYAERLENGWSQQAAAGVYNVALAEMTAVLDEEIKKSKYWSPT